MFGEKWVSGWGGIIANDGGGVTVVVWGLWVWFTCVIWVFVCGFYVCLVLAEVLEFGVGGGDLALGGDGITA
jgi:hypothetical protein